MKVRDDNELLETYSYMTRAISLLNQKEPLTKKEKNFIKGVRLDSSFLIRNASMKDMYGYIERYHTFVELLNKRGDIYE